MSQLRKEYSCISRMLVQSFCCCPVAKSCLTLCNPQEVDSSTQGSSVVHHLPEFSQMHIHWVSDATQTSHPLSTPSPPALSLSWHQSLFQWVNSLHEVAKVLEFSFSVIPSKEIPGLISFRMDWLDLLAVQGTLKSLVQHHSLILINSLALSLLDGPTLTSIHDFWK